MLNPNASNFTYRDAPVRPSIPGATYTSDFRATQPLSQLGYGQGGVTNYSTVRPVNIQAGQQVTNLPINFPSQSRVIGSRIVEPPRVIYKYKIANNNISRAQPGVCTAQCTHNRPANHHHKPSPSASQLYLESCGGCEASLSGDPFPEHPDLSNDPTDAGPVGCSTAAINNPTQDNRGSACASPNSQPGDSPTLTAGEV